ncbi:hypothetical protein GGS21DRAFT_486368 [Xylaria nigripes]|nr:hypothetical protein GGS21DRAFT_486368 [Xylaria nigripes]
MSDRIADLSPAQICQLFYLLSAAAVLAIAAAPDKAHRLLAQYGARSSGHASASTSSQNHGQDVTNGDTSLISLLIACLSPIGKVPHSWFTYFYILSLSCNLFWVVQFATNGRILDFIVRNQRLVSASSMTIGQVVLVQILIGLQAARRLYEHLAVLRPSSSSMLVVHWLLGIAFYVCTNVSVWVEGSRSIYDSGPNLIDIESPSLKSMIATSIFLVIAAPKGRLYNQTLACALVFVLANLGVTAHGTKQWYAEQFGSRVHRKWKMIPVLF